MFNKKELRIGSIVFNKDNRVCKVTHVQLVVDEISVSIFCDPQGHMVENISPIPLTDEILIKAGFNKGFNTVLPNQKSYSKDDLIFNQDFQLVTNNDGVSIVGKKIAYLHQLQNLYVTLIGSELELTEVDL